MNLPDDPFIELIKRHKHMVLYEFCDGNAECRSVLPDEKTTRTCQLALRTGEPRFSSSWNRPRFF